MSPLAIRSFGDAFANSASQFAKRTVYNLNDGDGVYYSSWSRKFAIIYLIAIAAILAFTALGWLVVAFVWYFRQEKRKKWYGPMAQYYRERGFGRNPMVGFNGAMYVPQVIYVPFGGQPGQPGQPGIPGAPQQPGGPFVGVPMQYPQAHFMTPGNQPQPQLQPINTSVTHVRSYNSSGHHAGSGSVGGGSNVGNGSGNGNGGAMDVAAGMSERDIAGPTAPMHDFNGATSHDPFASPRLQPYSHPQPPPEVHLEQAHGITEVHGGPSGSGVQQMSERRDVVTSNSLSFYSVPVGSQPNVSDSKRY